MAQIGRIGGPLLADNLLRNGSNIAFETSLLYVDVVNNRIGINTSSPGVDLYVANTMDTDIMSVASFIEVNGNSILAGNIFYHYFGNLVLQPDQTTNPTITTPALATDGLYIAGNAILNGLNLTGTIPDDLVLTPNGTGQLISNSDVLVNANLHATGDITFDGNVTLGDASTDRITITAEVKSDILPSANNTYKLGSSSLKWNSLNANALNVNSISPSSLTVTTLNAGNLSITGTTITNTLTNTNLNFTPNGTGQVLVNGSPVQYVNGNNLVNPYPGTDLIFGSINTGVSSGHFKFSGTSGVVIPNGTSTQYPSNPETGAIRYNTQVGYAEIFSGTQWQAAAGVANNATVNDVTDVSVLYSILFGF
jgi:hypothetical protein